MKKILALTLILLLLTTLGYTQKYLPGYILANSGDTIRGEIMNLKDGELSLKCIIKTNEEELKTFLPNEAIEYKFQEGRYFVSKEIIIDSIPTKLFLQFLFKGTVELYYHYDVKTLKEHYYVLKDNQLIKLENNEKQLFIEGTAYKGYDKKYIGVLKHLYGDAPEVIKKIDKLSFSSNSLIKISENYHNYTCGDQTCEKFKGKARSIHIGVRPFYRYETSSFTADFEERFKYYTTSGDIKNQNNYESIKFKSNKGYSYGLGISIYSSDLSFKVEYAYSKQFNEYNLDEEIKFMPLSPDENGIFSINKINHSIYFSYAFTQYLIQPVVTLSGMLGQYKNIGNSTGEELEIMDYLGYNIELGARYNFKKKILFELSTYYMSQFRDKNYESANKDLNLKETLWGINLGVNVILF